MMTAYTREIDDVPTAVAEIKSQLDLANLKTHTLGILVCYPDFVESGVVEALSTELPFPIIGMTAMASSNEHGTEMYGLSLTVLTSTLVSYTSVISGPLNKDNYIEETRKLYKEALSRLSNTSKLKSIIAFVPYLPDVSGHEMVQAIDAASGGVPIWGSVTTGVDMTYAGAATLLSGQAEQYGLALALIEGDFNPRFCVTTLPERNLRENRAIITDSEGCILRAINDTPILEYLASLGIIMKQELSTTIPILLYFSKNEKPVATGFFTVNDDGSLLCGTEVPVGTTIAVGTIDREGIIETTQEGLQKILEMDKEKEIEGILILPCVTRYIMLSPAQNEEMELVSKALHDKNRYMLGYSGGEICPLPDEKGVLHNRFHNYTFSSMVL
jgi:hypothetical protein